MTYQSLGAFRQGLEQRLLNQSLETGTDLNRLRRRVVFERILVRLVTTQPGLWIVKGGMAVELRIGDAARMTKDLDLNLRGAVEGTKSRSLHRFGMCGAATASWRESRWGGVSLR